MPRKKKPYKPPPGYVPIKGSNKFKKVVNTKKTSKMIIITPR